MPLLTLDLAPPSPDIISLQPLSVSRHPSLNLQPINTRMFPVRGLLYSFLFHEIAVIVMMFLPSYYGSRPAKWPAKNWELTMLPKDVLYLPPLGGGEEGGSPKKADSGGSPGGGRSPKVATKVGVTYAGPQTIVSNPVNPTSHIQTILQPDLPKPPILKTFVPL